MIEIQGILCPIDFSEYSRHALDHAVALARRYESAVTVLYVFPTVPVAAYAPGMPGFDPIVLTPPLREQLLVDMKGFIETESAPGVSIAPMIREGDPVGEILSQATDMKAGLLVMGTHGRSGFERLLLGSVTEKILRKASCPVLTVPRRHPDAVPATAVLFKRILCAVDFSDCSLHALEYAISLAQEADAQLTVLHVLGEESDVTPDAYGAIIMNDLETLADFRKRHEDAARKRLKEVVPGSVAEYCSVETRVSRGVKPSREILRIAAEQRTDLIVVGVQGRGAANLMFFGSTTNHVVREATCPVLTVRQG
jgi:nucleotide-binding universal stress UspA family protein